MAKRIAKPTAADITRLQLENSILSKKIALTEKTFENSLSGLVAGLGAGNGVGMGQSPITSFNPILQNSQYAPVTLMWTTLMYFYKTFGLVQTAIDTPVLDAIRGGLDFHSDQLDPDDIKELEDWLEENSVLERICDAFIWARLFGGGALIINTEGDCESPIGDEVMDGGKIEFYDASRWELTCERRIPKSGHYGFYGKSLDESRVITILGKRAPWLIRAQLSDWGFSEIERVVEDFNIYLRTRNVIYEILEEAKIDIYKLKGFTAQLASPTGTALTTRRIQATNQIKNFNNALVLDKEDDYEVKQLGFGGLAEIMNQNRMGIASAFRMPMSKLFGIPSTGFSSGEDDLENYAGLVESEVRGPMRQVIRKVLKLAVEHLFGDKDLEISFKFKPLRNLSAMDEETVKTSKSNRYLSMFDKQLMSSREVGEAMQKDNLVPIPLEAEQGLLEDHPMPIMPPALGGEASDEEKGEDPVDAKAEPQKLPKGKGGDGKPKKPEKPEKPEKPKLNERKN